MTRGGWDIFITLHIFFNFIMDQEATVFATGKLFQHRYNITL
jgi:hypothetical protein